MFKNGRNQVLRIPKEFEPAGDEAIIRREGDKLIIEPICKDGLLSVLANLRPFEESFPDIDEPLPVLDDVKL